MGLFDGIFTPSTPDPKPTNSWLDSLLGGSTGASPDTSHLFGHGGGEPILPHGGSARGRGGQPFSSVSGAEKSQMITGIVRDPYTGYVGTPQEIHDRYRAEGRDTSKLVDLFRRS